MHPINWFNRLENRPVHWAGCWAVHRLGWHAVNYCSRLFSLWQDLHLPYRFLGVTGEHTVRRLTLTNMSSSDLRRFSSFSISIWHVWQTYRWLTAGPPPYLRGAAHSNSRRKKSTWQSKSHSNCERGIEGTGDLGAASKQSHRWPCLPCLPAVEVIPHILRQHDHQVVDECCLVGRHTWRKRSENIRQTSGSVFCPVLRFVALWDNHFNQRWHEIPRRRRFILRVHEPNTWPHLH